ncbi:type II toxin-antitoxin system RelE/ParE family toxin [Tautonia sp. JC769]|uniref:type II toxin-antitoxin system RelE/ParE family toxin n=1 Tax=Tautonia sp. JC769 TaxID=3232135 RepID=UPI00345B4B72
MIDVRFHPEAQAEYQDALAWYQVRSRQAAERFEAETDRVLDLIQANPGLFPKYDEEHRFVMLRRFPYSLVYQVQPDQILVVAVAHSRRSADFWQGRA